MGIDGRRGTRQGVEAVAPAWERQRRRSRRSRTRFLDRLLNVLSVQVDLWTFAVQIHDLGVDGELRQVSGGGRPTRGRRLERRLLSKG